MKKWKSPAPKKRRRKDIEFALTSILAPPVIAGALLFGVGKKKKRSKKKKFW